MEDEKANQLADKFQCKEDPTLVDANMLHYNLTGKISRAQADEILDEAMSHILKHLQIYGGSLLGKFREADTSGDMKLQK